MVFQRMVGLWGGFFLLGFLFAPLSSACAQKVDPDKAALQKREMRSVKIGIADQVQMPELKPKIDPFPEDRFRAREQALYFDVMMLASDRMEGRLTGSVQDLEAALYIGKAFMENGLVPLEQGYKTAERGTSQSDYFQEYSFDARWGEHVLSRNVVGVVPGNDPELSDRFVVVGAHFDHLGWGDKVETSMRKGVHAIHNGADDNASGVAMLLELVRYYTERPLRKSLVFVAFSGEEVGMTGSSAFLDKFPFDRKRIDAMFNLDMLGGLQGKEFRINGVGTSRETPLMVDNAQRSTSLRLLVSKDGYGPSDHAVFYAAGIPVLFFCTSPDETYHTPDDDVDRLNYSGMSLISEVVGNLLEQVGNAGPLHFVQAGPPEAPAMRSDKFKVTLGLMPDINNTAEKGLTAMIVVEGKPAYKAGLRSGDVILRIDGKKVESIEQYMEILSALEPGGEILLQAVRKKEGKKVKLKVSL